MNRVTDRLATRHTPRRPPHTRPPRAAVLLAENMTTWATLVSKKPEEPASKPAAPLPTSEAAARNGGGENGAPAPVAPRPSTAPAPAPPAAPPPRKAPLYEPAPNEIMRITLTKPQPDAKLGIRLAGEDRPRIISLNPEGLAAKAGCLAVGDVFLKVGLLPHTLCWRALPSRPSPHAQRARSRGR